MGRAYRRPFSVLFSSILILTLSGLHGGSSGGSGRSHSAPVADTSESDVILSEWLALDPN